jgi:hypothetical protein
MRLLIAAALWVLFASVSHAILVHQTIPYKPPIQRISGRVLGFGNVNPGVTVRVLDKPEVLSDDSLNFTEKRKRQSTIASTTTNSKGEFTFRRLPKGAYEVEFSGRQGWNPLSVLVNVDPAGSSAKLCVVMSLEDAGERPSVDTCPR